MSDLTNIIRKETKELLTPGSIISVVVMVILLASLGTLIGDEVQKSTELPKIGISDNYDEQIVTTPEGDWNAYESLISIYTNAGFTREEAEEYVVPVSIDEIQDRITELGLSFVLVIPDDFAMDISNLAQGKITQYYLYEPSGMIRGTVSSTLSSILIDQMNKDLSNKLIGSKEKQEEIKFITSPIDGSNTMTIIDGKAYDDVTPADISNTMTGQTIFIPMIIMIIIMMVGSIVISSMGSEKENKTLETLLTLPIKRTTVVTGKILAAALVGLIFGLAYMAGMAIYIGSITNIDPNATGTIDLSKYGLELGLVDYALIMLSMFLAISCALGICMILGAFAKNNKSAQTMTLPLSILAIIPMFITMFSGWYGANIAVKVILFAIPFSHPMMATSALMNGDLTLVFAGLAYMAVFAIVTILVTVRLYRSDILITGLGQNKYIEGMKSRGKRKA